MGEYMRRTAGEVIAAGKRGHWNESEISGVECPFCGEWSALPRPICKNGNCKAELSGINYRYIKWKKSGLPAVKLPQGA